MCLPPFFHLRVASWKTPPHCRGLCLTLESGHSERRAASIPQLYHHETERQQEQRQHHQQPWSHSSHQKPQHLKTGKMSAMRVLCLQTQVETAFTVAAHLPGGLQPGPPSPARKYRKRIRGMNPYKGSAHPPGKRTIRVISKGSARLCPEYHGEGGDGRA